MIVLNFAVSIPQAGFWRLKLDRGDPAIAVGGGVSIPQAGFWRLKRRGYGDAGGRIVRFQSLKRDSGD